MNEKYLFVFLLSLKDEKWRKFPDFICNILYSSTGVMRASNPSHSCREEASNTPVTSTQEEKHPQSLPRGRKNERLYRMDLPRNWMSLQEEVQEPSIKRRLDVNQRRRSISVQLYQLVRRGVQSQDTHHSTEDLYAAAQSQEEAMTLLEEVTNSQETPKRMNRKERIKWPDSIKWCLMMIKKTSWTQLPMPV